MRGGYGQRQSNFQQPQADNMMSTMEVKPWQRGGYRGGDDYTQELKQQQISKPHFQEGREQMTMPMKDISAQIGLSAQ